MEKAKEVKPEEAPAKKKNDGAPSTLISARVFECFSPPPANTFKVSQFVVPLSVVYLYLLCHYT